MFQDLRIKKNRELKPAENSRFQRGSTLIFDSKIEPRCPLSRIFGYSFFPQGRTLNLQKGSTLVLLLLSFLILYSLFLIPSVASAATIKAPPSNLSLIAYYPFDICARTVLATNLARTVFAQSGDEERKCYDEYIR